MATSRLRMPSSGNDLETALCWRLQNEDALKQFKDTTDAHFQNKYGYGVYKNNSFSQLLIRPEVDNLGIFISCSGTEIYAIDVAFHESGLNYGDRKETVVRGIKKFIRTVLCLIGLFGIKKREIIFASPKIHPKFPCLIHLYKTPPNHQTSPPCIFKLGHFSDGFLQFPCESGFFSAFA